MAKGAVMIIAGVWLIAQTIGGKLVHRIGIG